MLNRNIKLGLTIAVVFGLIALVIWFGGSNEKPMTTASPTSSPTAGFANAEPEIEGYTREFGVKYFTYKRPDDPRYLDSIRPFLDPNQFTVIANENRQAPAGSKPISGEVLSVEVEQTSELRAVAEVRMRIDESGTDPYEQTIRLLWQKSADRWSITDFELLESTKRYPYLEE